VTFECTVLFAGLATVAAMFLLNGLPNIRRKAFDPGLTRDRFALMIEAPLEIETDETEPSLKKDAKNFKPFNESEATEFLRKSGAKEVKSVYTEGWF
jgi:hypothetical protein